ncbi:MAG: hypothetical protein JWP37_1719 [Mucilaginibacter sp.]|nr:hypothetical protein [Mucilaginibacter sp.]
MKPKILLRVAAILILIHAVLHTIGFSGWKNDPDTARHQMIQLMTGQKFPFMGTSRNMGEYYDGFGYTCSIALIVIALILWFTSGEFATNTSLAKKVILILSFGLLFWGIDELIYFFPFAALITLLASVCGFWSLFGLAKQVASK